MSKKQERIEKNITQNESDLRAIRHIKESVARGKHWYWGLLESIKIWNSAEEYYDGRYWKYLIDGEAFDWLLLAERLCSEIKESIPENELIALLFFDKPPVELPNEEFKQLIGLSKYKAYLNYTYGVLVEEALISTIIEEVRKEKRSLGSVKDDGVNEKAYRLIYGAREEELLQDFMRDKGYSRRKNISLSEIKEFLYWSFKYRIKHSENSRVASDTKKALLYLQNIVTLKSKLN